MNKRSKLPILWALLAAALYAISAPVSKLLLGSLSPVMMAALLYLGAGIGMAGVGLVRRGTGHGDNVRHLTRSQRPYIVGMVALDILAPILLMVGLARTTAANAALLNNFEIVATSLIALAFFREAITRRLWAAIGLITVSSLLLSFQDMSSLSFSVGSFFVLLACVGWGLENNCTRMLSGRDSLEIVVIKGFGSGLGSLIIALFLGEAHGNAGSIAAALLLGFVAYGLSIFFYVLAQRDLGAARTSAYYAVAPFIGVGISFLFFREAPTLVFIIALAVMMAGAFLAASGLQPRREE